MFNDCQNREDDGVAAAAGGGDALSNYNRVVGALGAGFSSFGISIARLL